MKKSNKKVSKKDSKKKTGIKKKVEKAVKKVKKATKKLPSTAKSITKDILDETGKVIGKATATSKKVGNKLVKTVSAKAEKTFKNGFAKMESFSEEITSDEAVKLQSAYDKSLDEILNEVIGPEDQEDDLDDPNIIDVDEIENKEDEE